MLSELKVIYGFAATFLSLVGNNEAVSFDRRIKCNNSPVLCERSCAYGSNTGGTCLELSPGQSECFCYEKNVQRTICDGYVGADRAKSTCKGFCRSIGRTDGFCERSRNDCICSENRVPHFGANLCVTNQVCVTFCKTYRGLPGGACRGIGASRECQCTERYSILAVP